MTKSRTTLKSRPRNAPLPAQPLDAAARDRLAEDGYLVLPGLLDRERDLGPLRSEYHSLLDAVARRLHAEGAVTSSYADLPFDRRFCALVGEMGGALMNHMDICLPQRDIDANSQVHCGPAAFGLLTNPRLLDAVEQIVGPEIYANPTQHVRIKPPEECLAGDTTIVGEIARAVWHQDLATVMPEADGSRMLTVWIPITSSTRENGCLLVAPGSHKKGLATHCHDPRANYSRQAIPEDLVGDRRVALEMEPGDVLFLTKLTMHASLPNLSRDVRWSVDLRYQPVGEPTGRPWFPGFVARSRAAPESVLPDAEAWAALWREARDRLTASPPSSFQRWPQGNPDRA